MTKASKAKAKFRSTSAWKDWRKHMKKLFSDKDYITGYPLRAGFNVHHIAMQPERYEILDEKLFVPLNRTTHKLVHFLYGYYKKDKAVIDRLKLVLDRMVQENEL